MQTSTDQRLRDVGITQFIKETEEDFKDFWKKMEQSRKRHEKKSKR